MEFKSYPASTGFMALDAVTVDGPCEPGTPVSWDPRATGFAPRRGLIVAVHSDQVDIVWGPLFVDDVPQPGFELNDVLWTHMRILSRWFMDNGLVVMTARQQRERAERDVL